MKIPPHNKVHDASFAILNRCHHLLIREQIRNEAITCSR